MQEVCATSISLFLGGTRVVNCHVQADVDVRTEVGLSVTVRVGGRKRVGSLSITLMTPELDHRAGYSRDRVDVACPSRRLR
jgi:hypothetical protein